MVKIPKNGNKKEKPNKAPKTEGKGELPGMPPKGALGDQADAVVKAWEAADKAEDALAVEKKKLLPLLKKSVTDAEAKGKSVKSTITLKNSKGQYMDIGISSGLEKIFIHKRRETMKK